MSLHTYDVRAELKAQLAGKASRLASKDIERKNK